MTSLELTVASPHDSCTRQIIADHYPFSLGRALQNDLPLPFESVSARHLVIETVGRNTVRVTDLETTNGTRIDDRRLPPGQTVTVELPVRLRLGDIPVTIRRLDDQAETAFTMAQSSTRLREMVDQAVRQSHDDRQQPFFEILTGPEKGRRHNLEPGDADVVIGTDSSADVTLTAPAATGRLATVTWRDSRCWLIPESDAIELEQSILDGERRLRSGDRFVIDSLKLVFFDPLEDALESLEPDADLRPDDRNRDSSSTTDPAHPPPPKRSSSATGTDASNPTGPDSGSRPATDTSEIDSSKASNQKRPAPESKKHNSVAGLGIVELALLAMSLFFLLGTVALLILFLSA